MSLQRVGENYHTEPRQNINQKLARLVINDKTEMLTPLPAYYKEHIDLPPVPRKSSQKLPDCREFDTAEDILKNK